MWREKLTSWRPEIGLKCLQKLWKMYFLAKKCDVKFLKTPSYPLCLCHLVRQTRPLPPPRSVTYYLNGMASYNIKYKNVFIVCSSYGQTVPVLCYLCFKSNICLILKLIEPILFMNVINDVINEFLIPQWPNPIKARRGTGFYNIVHFPRK